MASDIAVKIAGTGTFLPGDPVPFDQVNRVLGELHEAPKRVRKWMASVQSVMREVLDTEFYHFALDPETREFTEDNITMSAKAGREALQAAGVGPDAVELICYGAPYLYQMPPASALIQEALGIEQCAEIAVQANCTSAYKALLLAAEMIRSGRYQNALVVSSNMPSSQLCAEHYNQPLAKKEDVFLRWYLSDGAAAIFLQADTRPSNGTYLEHTYMESAGGNKPSAMFTQWPGHYVNPKEVYDRGLHHLKQLFQNEVRVQFQGENHTVLFEGLQRMAATYAIDLGALRFLQINMPTKHVVDLFVDEIAQCGIRREQIYSPVVKMGYAGPPAAFMSVDELIRGQLLEPGDVMLSFVTEVSKLLQAGFTLRCRGEGD